MAAPSNTRVTLAPCLAGNRRCGRVDSISTEREPAAFPGRMAGLAFSTLGGTSGSAWLQPTPRSSRSAKGPKGGTVVRWLQIESMGLGKHHPRATRYRRSLTCGRLRRPMSAATRIPTSGSAPRSRPSRRPMATRSLPSSMMRAFPAPML